MHIRQSDIATWQRCPLLYRFSRTPGTVREQSGALTFGTILHDAVMHMEIAQDLQVGLDRFTQHWLEPTLLDPELEIDYYLKMTSWAKYKDDGPKIVKDWWSIIQWENDVVLGREQGFSVPIGEHVLDGTIDKLAIRRIKGGEYVLLISDYKTNSKRPTYDYLRHNIQFTAYAYATTQPEFWTGVENGEWYYEQTKDMRRVGEWVQLRGPLRLDAGERTPQDYQRLRYAVDMMADSIAMGIYVPNISGESCTYCDYRKPCGLPTREEEGLAS